MASWSVAIIILSVVFLTIRHGTSILDALPQWVRPGKRRMTERKVQGNDTSPGTAPPAKGRLKGFKAMSAADERSEDELTPKAQPTPNGIAVPTFSLDEDAEGASTSFDHAQTTSFPAARSPQGIPSTASALEPSDRVAQRTPTSLMPPPPRPTPKPTSNLRIPSNGPLPNRGPPANSQQRVNSSLAPNGAVSTSNSRGKVLLAPGHSPMDWAALTRKGNLSGVSTFQRVTPSALRSMTGRRGKPAWSSWQGKVYNITPYIPFHPGGEAEIMKAAGRDGEKLFMEVHPWVNWDNMLGSCLVGVLVPGDYGKGNEKKASLEDID